MSQRAGWLFLLGGVGLAVVGGVAIYRRKNEPLGRVVNRLAEPAPVVGRAQSGGMTMTHRRSSNMTIEQRLRSIQDLVWKSVQMPTTRQLAMQIIRKCPERDEVCEAKAIYDYVRPRFRYTGDIAPVKQGSRGPTEPIDLYQRADRTLEFGGGDCDDANILYSALSTSIGLPTRLRVTAETKTADDGHIYPVVGIPKMNPTKWVAADLTLPGRNNFGKEVPYGRNSDFRLDFDA